MPPDHVSTAQNAVELAIGVTHPSTPQTQTQQHATSSNEPDTKRTSLGTTGLNILPPRTVASQACLGIPGEAQLGKDVGKVHGYLVSNTYGHRVEQEAACLLLLHLWTLPTVWVNDGVGGPWVS